MTEDAPLARVREVLEAAGLTDRITVVDAEVPTAVAAAEKLGCDVGADPQGATH